MLIEYIIFDCDGVLIDSEIIANRIEMEVKNELGFPITLEEQLQKFVGLGLSHHLVQDEIRRLPSHYSQLVEDRLQLAFANELRAIDGVCETLAKLQLPKCVASSSEPESLAFKLKHTNLDHHFGDAIFSARSVRYPKPAPDLFLFALDQMLWKPQTTLVIEDSVPGVQAAKAAGLRVWGFLGGAHIRTGHADRLTAAGAERIISKFDDIPIWIRKN